MKKLIITLLVLSLSLSLCACGASTKNTAMVAAAPMEAVRYDGAMMESNSVGFAMDASVGGAVSDEVPQDNPEKIIYSADVTVETTDFESSLAKLDELVKGYGAWVESSSVSGADYYHISRERNYNRSANYTLRVPSQSFNTLMTSLSELGNIPYTHTYTENVTAQYYDAQARLNAYTAQESRLLEMMEKAETVSDVIAIEEKLTELRYRIESIQTSLNNWDRRVDYSYIYLDVQEVSEYTPEAKESFASKLSRAFTGGFEDALVAIQNFALWLVGSIPAIIAIGIAVVVARPFVKKARAKRKAKKEE